MVLYLKNVGWTAINQHSTLVQQNKFIIYILSHVWHCLRKFSKPVVVNRFLQRGEGIGECWEIDTEDTKSGKFFII